MSFRKQLALPLAFAALFALAVYVVAPAFAPVELSDKQLQTLGGEQAQQYGMVLDSYRLVLKLLKIGLWLSLMFASVRLASHFVFSFIFRLRKGREAPRLVRDLIALVAYVLIATIVLKYYFPELSLGALLSGSALLGVILGLALQDTLGNLFAGLSLHADKPFSAGDVMTVGRWTGVVESVTWRAVKIRTFTNHVVLASNAVVSKETIEVCPRDNRNARLVFFNAVYSNSPAKVIHVVREAVREAENVSQEITPIVRIRDLGASSVDYEVKYWLEDYARFNDTDALVRQRIWYAYRRAGLSFAYPTQTLYVERPARDGDGAGAAARSNLIERLSAVDVFAPLSADELERLARGVARRVYAPGETIIRAGEQGSSMFVVHEGSVAVQISDNGRPRTIASLQEGDFFGEMALFTGEPRTASVVAAEETEVFEIGHDAMKKLFDKDPELAESLSHTIAERRRTLAAQAADSRANVDESDGLLSSIKRFFGLD
ncbi:MAG: cyclic nucleotide-binding domain-containing protein [Pyrinomonadaceae bacterium]